MVITNKTTLPTEEELTVQEVTLSYAPLRAGAVYFGKYCEAENNEYHLCSDEERDPRKCLNEGKNVTACALEFFQKVKRNCAEEFTQYAECLNKSSSAIELSKCRKTQSVFDHCMLNKMGMERPHYGYFLLPKVCDTKRPKPEKWEPEFKKAFDELPKDYERKERTYNNRYVIGE